MDRDETLDDLIELPEVTDPAIRRMLGLFDIPAFARRGLDVVEMRDSLRRRCQKQRLEWLGMIHLRLRQWAAAAVGTDDWHDVFDSSVAALWELTEAPAPTWARVPATRGRRRAAAQDLVASLERFNRRWLGYVQTLDLEPFNRVITKYNEYYTLEKECALGSARLAARFYRPEEPITVEQILGEHPPLPIPRLKAARA